MKTLTILFIVLITAYSFPQENVLFEKQKKTNAQNLREVQRIKLPLNTSTTQVLKPINLPNEINMIDTLRYYGYYNSNFGIFGQDWILQWFKAPTDLVIKGLGFYCMDNPNDTPVEAKIVKVNWTEAQLISAETLQRGYYEALGNGYNDITSFLDNPDRTGGWTSIQPVDTEPFEYDIWSDNGVGYSFIPDETLNDHQWIDMNLLGNEPFLNYGEIFGVAVKNTSAVMDSDRVGFLAGYSVGYPFWKFYANGRLIPGVDYGWWTRELTFDFQVAVDISYNPLIPFFVDYSRLTFTLSTDPRPVSAIVTLGFGGHGVPEILVSALVSYSTDNGAIWHQNLPLQLNHVSDSLYTGELPGFPAGTMVSYYFEATDTLRMNTSRTPEINYSISRPPWANTLVVFNGFTTPTGYPQEYYFGSGEWPNNDNTLIFDHDVWAYGPLTAELLSNYRNVLEICTNGPNDINSDAIRAWLEESGDHNYMLAGDEWLGAQSNWTDGPHSAGDFIFDILGINYEYNDVNYAVAGDENKPSIVYPQSGSMLGGPIFDLYTQVSTDSGWTAPMTYDPFYEIDVSNWLDGVDFEPDVEVDMKGLAINGTTVYNIGGHRTLPAGNKIAFFAFDPLSLNSDTENEVEYFWYGFMNTAPYAEPLLDWFGIPVGVEKEDDLLPDTYTLSQNYPNPFNPSTVISYQLPVSGLVSLKVYDILGREVTTLVNEEKPAGKYEVIFNVETHRDASLPSGVYFYRIQAGSFTQTKKMLLIK